MKPEIKTRPAGTVIGFGAKFKSILSGDKSNFQVIPGLWQEFGKRKGEIQGRANGEAVGVVFRTPGSDGDCYYVAGAEVSEGASPAAGMEKRALPAGKYAVFTHRGRIEKLGDTMGFIHGSWLPASGYKLGAAPEIERYDGRFRPDSDESAFDIWIPLA